MPRESEEGEGDPGPGREKVVKGPAGGHSSRERIDQPSREGRLLREPRLPRPEEHSPSGQEVLEEDRGLERDGDGQEEKQEGDRVKDQVVWVRRQRHPSRDVGIPERKMARTEQRRDIESRRIVVEADVAEIEEAFPEEKGVKEEENSQRQAGRGDPAAGTGGGRHLLLESRGPARQNPSRSQMSPPLGLKRSKRTHAPSGDQTG